MPGHEARDQQLADRLLGDDAVDHQQRAGRDQRIERGAGRADARRQPLVVFRPQHLGDRHLGEHGGGRAAGARHRREAGDREHGAGGEAAGQPAEPASRRLEGGSG